MKHSTTTEGRQTMVKKGGARERLEKIRKQYPDVEEEYQRQAPRYALVRELIRVRKSAGLSQTELARRIGTTQGVISRLESGEHSPKFETVADAARALGYRLDVKLTRDRSIEVATAESA